MCVAVASLLYLGFSESTDHDRAVYTTPALGAGVDPRVVAAQIQGQATENSGIRTRQVAAVVASGAALSLLLSFLNLSRESRKDAHERAVAEAERLHERDRLEHEKESSEVAREHELIRLANLRFAQAIEHLRVRDDLVVRTAGIKALEMLAEEPFGPREEVNAVMKQISSEARGSDVPADVQAAREASERLSAGASSLRDRLLEAIRRSPGMTATQAAEDLSVSRVTVARALRFLIDEGHVERRPHPSDVRSYSLFAVDGS